MTEEVARWAFEVWLEERAPEWELVFTNPTAGPWKTVKVSDSVGTPGELVRFGRSDERPDLLLLSDEHRAVLVFEAKDRLVKLRTGDQSNKNARVVHSVEQLLSGQADNPLWRERSSYTVIGGLLWGGKATEREAIDGTLSEFRALLASHGQVDTSLVVGVEVKRVQENGHISPQFFAIPDNDVRAMELRKSLGFGDDSN